MRSLNKSTSRCEKPSAANVRNSVSARSVVFAGKPAQKARHRLIVGQRDACFARGTQVVGYSRVLGERNASHRVDHVAVERREETKAMLAGQIAPAVAAAAGHPLALRFAAYARARLVHADAKSALREFLRSAQACDCHHR